MLRYTHITSLVKTTLSYCKSFVLVYFSDKIIYIMYRLSLMYLMEDNGPLFCVQI
jgi:hypothetical protein